MSEDDGFLGRWSRRKRQVARTEAPASETEATDAPGPRTLPDAPEPEPETDEEILARLELPDPNTLSQGDDFTRYLKAPLPAHIKTRALRRLWRSNPVFGHLDGLNEYDTDFTGGSVPMGALKTAYQVGRGFLSATEDEAQASEVAEKPGPEVAAAEEPESVPEPSPAAVEAQDAVDVPAVAEGALADPQEGTEEDADPRPSRRRMAFRFDDLPNS